MFSIRLAAILLALMAAPVFAHEFWIEPRAYMIQKGDKLQADFKNGEEFKGGNLSFFDRTSARFDLFAAGKLIKLEPRAGDSPALDVLAPVQDGLVVVVHETTPSSLTYKEWAKFMRFAAHKDFPQAEADHIAAGWSQDKFRERYTRHVKSLMAVGSGRGADRIFGLQTEFVAMTNPYDPDFSNKMVVSLLDQGRPRPNAQVEVFERAPNGAVNIRLHRTNGKGIARVRVRPGHDYLFDAVVLRPAPEADVAEGALVWETYWAALTFTVPE